MRRLASFTTGTDAQSVETMNPVAQRLTIHAADAHSVRSPHPIENGSQRQETPASTIAKALYKSGLVP